MDPPTVDRQSDFREGALPGEDVRIDGIDERAVEIEDERTPRPFQAGDVIASSRQQEASLDDKGHKQVAIAVLVEQHGQLVAVVALYGAFAPAVASHPAADRKRLGSSGRPDACLVVVAVPARAAVVLAEVREQEGTATTRVLRVAPHHLEPGPLDLIFALALGRRCTQRLGNAQFTGPANLPVD